MASTQKEASVSRQIMFRTKGQTYTAFLHSSTGDIIQQYDSTGAWYPDFTPSSPLVVRLIVTSSKTSGTVQPSSVEYKVAGVTLAFDSSGSCTTSGYASYFKRVANSDGSVDLWIIGNIGDALGKVSALLEVTAKVGNDSIYACRTIDISEYQGGARQKVSIAAADNKAFTLTSSTDSVKMKAGVLTKNGWVYNSPNLIYVWKLYRTTAFEPLGGAGSGAAGTVTVPALLVNSMATVMVSVYRKTVGGITLTEQMISSGSPIAQKAFVGSDRVDIVDASDPLTVNLTYKVSATGNAANETDALAEELDDTMPAGAYVVYTPTLMERAKDGKVTAVSGSVTWENAFVFDPAGIKIRTIAPSSGKYYVHVSDLGASYGEYSIQLTGKLS